MCVCSSLRSSGDLTSDVNNAHFGYFLHLCGPLQSAGAAAMCVQNYANVSACIKADQGVRLTFDLGNWDEAATKFTWTDASKTAVTFNMTGEMCDVEKPARPHTVEVVLHCADKQGPHKVAGTTPVSCTTFLSMDTPLACIRPKPAPQATLAPHSSCSFEGLDFSYVSHA